MNSFKLVFSYVLILLSPILMAQTDKDINPEVQNSKVRNPQIKRNPEQVRNPEIQNEEISAEPREGEEQAEEERVEEETQGPVMEPDQVQVQCVCPQNQDVLGIEAEERPEVPSIFPPGTVVNVVPVQEEQQKTPEEEREELNRMPPGYIEQLPSGYSNDQFRPIYTY